MADRDKTPGHADASLGAVAPVAQAGTPVRTHRPSLARAPRARDEFELAPHGFGRSANRTADALESALGKLEGPGVRALVFPSGPAVIAALFHVTLRAGDIVVAPRDSFPAAHTIAREELARLGVAVRPVPSDTEAIVTAAAAPAAKLVLVETPSNPGLDVVDVKAVAEATHAGGARLVIDNTLATPLGQRPLELGADATVMSGFRTLTGHGDVLLGSIASRDVDLLASLRRWRKGTGALVGPFEAWLAHRSLATLALRLERQCANAQALAELLCARADVADVRYLGLAADRWHPLAALQMARFGTVLTFDLGDAGRARRFVEAGELVREATARGDVRTTADRQARDHGNGIPTGSVRLSVGIEDLVDLRSDVEQALDAAAP